MVVLIGAVVFVPDAIALNNEKLSPEIRGMVADRILTLHARIWPSIIAMVCIFAIHSFRVFLKVVGPLYRFRWAFAKIIKGEMDFRVRLRRKDYLLREATMFNEMINVLTEKIGKHAVDWSGCNRIIGDYGAVSIRVEWRAKKISTTPKDTSPAFGESRGSGQLL